MEDLHRLPRHLPAADQSAAFRLLFSLVKKVLIADSLASLAQVAFRAAAQPGHPSFPTLLFVQGFYLYAIEIYADFSGYTDLACGSAFLLGFHLPENFRQPISLLLQPNSGTAGTCLSRPGSASTSFSQ